MKNLFFQKLIEKRGLEDQVIEFMINQKKYQMDMRDFIQRVGEKNDPEQKFINQSIMDIEFFNGDIMEFIVFLARSYFLEENYQNLNYL